MSAMEDRVAAQVTEHLLTADEIAVTYARVYARALRTGRSQMVRPPRGLHPDLARMVREVARDAVGRRIPGTSRTV